MKFGINTTLVVSEMLNFTWLHLMKFLQFLVQHSIMTFIPNFTATHAITSTNIMTVLLV